MGYLIAVYSAIHFFVVLKSRCYCWKHKQAVKTVLLFNTFCKIARYYFVIFIDLYIQVKLFGSVRFFMLLKKYFR